MATRYTSNVPGGAPKRCAVSGGQGGPRHGRRASVLELTYLPGFFFSLMASSRAFLGATSTSRADRVTWERK